MPRPEIGAGSSESATIIWAKAHPAAALERKPGICLGTIETIIRYPANSDPIIWASPLRTSVQTVSADGSTMKRFGSSPAIYTRDMAAAERKSPARRLVVAAALCMIGVLSGAGFARAQTYDPDYPVCLHVYGPVNYYSCHYFSIPQCAPLAVGRSAECVVNPYYAGPPHEALPRRHRYQRKAKK